MLRFLIRSIVIAGFLAPFLKKLCFIFCTCERKNSIPIYVTRTRIENNPHASHHILYLFESRWQARVVVRQIAFHQAIWSAPVFAAFTYHQLHTYRLPFSTFAGGRMKSATIWITFWWLTSMQGLHPRTVSPWLVEWTVNHANGGLQELMLVRTTFRVTN